MKYLFGPINSRRLGISLGVDLLPYKTCTLNCSYCECGLTTDLTCERKDYVPTDEVIGELLEYLTNKPHPDYVTFSGSGEPTLHTGIGKIIASIKNNFPEQKVAVITNSTLLWKEEVRDNLVMADLIVPSMDAVSENVFRKFLEPAEGITAEKVIEGIVALRKEFKGLIFLEIFLAPGINDSDDEIRKMKEAVSRIMPDAIELNSLERPAPRKWVNRMDIEELESIAAKFKPYDTRIVTRKQTLNSDANDPEIQERIVSSLKRRAHTLKDISLVIGLEEKEASKILNEMINSGKIIMEEKDGINTYHALQ